MSNSDALAGVTAALKELLRAGIAARAVRGEINVTALPPDRVSAEANDARQLNVFLYQVTHNEGRRVLPNADRSIPQHAVVDLHYIITAYGAEEFDAEMLLGNAIDVFHEQPVLTRAALEDVLDRAQRSRDWAKHVSQIQITPANLSIDLLASLWTAFGVSYRTSLAYVVRVAPAGRGE